MNRIAILGSGAMGSRLAHNLLKADYAVVVYNRTVSKAQPLLEKGATLAITPREAAEQANLVISMVTDDEASRQIWLDPQIGASLGMGSQQIALESSTLTVAWTKTLATTLAQRDIPFLEVPVVGSRPQAEAGKLIGLAGGDPDILKVVEPVLHSAGIATIHSIGSIGQGMAMKLAVNGLFGTQVAALAEALAILGQQGIPALPAMVCLSQLPVISPAAQGAGCLIAANQHTPLFPIALVEKDFRYLLAHSPASFTPVSTTMQQVYEKAVAQGYGAEHITAVAQLFAP
ncbi:MAG: NAD(P)-dependent oxidoreductase [Cyanobacteriota bacterium]|nr:NAD(P)-dependent oxidoreductase [Cyanobacteriota bacterium]